MAATAALWAAMPADARAPDTPAPGIFYGVLPCASCPGIEHHLELFADGAFYLRTTYQDRDGGPFDDIGSWLRSSDGEVLALFGGREAPLRFSVAGPDALGMLDPHGRPIDSALNYTLARDDARERIEPSLHMRGMFTYFADSAILQECLTGRSMPVAMEQDYLRLEQAYMESRREPADSLLVNLTGRIVERVNMEGPARPTVVVEEFKGIWPGESCGARFANADFFETYWKLTQLEGEPVIVGEQQREPHMIFRDGDTASVAGYGGCNRFTGGLKQDETTLDFGVLAATQMACADTMAREHVLLQTLSEVRRWNIIGQHLELFDEEGRLRARLEAVYLK
jgi:copper homeostasis protein (lipoprotein)